MANTYTIYANQLEEVTKRLDRIASKAARYSVPFAYKVGDERPATVRVLGVDPAAPSTLYEMSRYTVAAIDIEVDCDELIKANGWTVRAKVEHGDKGNIVTAFGSKPAEPEWYTAPAKCDHCGTNRARSVTFFCENAEGELRQVGRACLKDYTGINPTTAAMWAEVQDLLARDMDCTAVQWNDRHPVIMHDVLLVLAHAYDTIKADGYRKSDEPHSTKKEVTQRVLSCAEPTAEGMEEAKRIRDWLVGLDEVARAEDAREHEEYVALFNQLKAENPDASDEDIGAMIYTTGTRDVRDLERNCIPLALSGFARVSHFGRLAYMPIAYKRYIERKAREERAAAAGAASEHVGTVGQRITVKTASAALLTSWDGMYGTTWLYKFVDETGNVFIWYASRPIDVADGMTLKATIKDHNERNGVKQTVLTRCKAA